MCRVGHIALRDYQESVTIRQTHGLPDARQIDQYVPLHFAGDTKIVHFDLKCLKTAYSN